MMNWNDDTQDEQRRPLGAALILTGAVIGLCLLAVALEMIDPEICKAALGIALIAALAGLMRRK